MMPRTSDALSDRYARWLKLQGELRGFRFETVCRERQLALKTLERRGIVTIADLLARFPDLSRRQKSSALDLIAILKIREAVPALFAELSAKTFRLTCADLLGQLGSAKVVKHFLQVGQRELSSQHPDLDWLEAAIYALGYTDDGRATELLVSIFERCDLPGWIRGEAGDKLGGREIDRRTTLYRRCRDSALGGLSDDSIHVQFWSMFVIASLANVRGTERAVDGKLRSALPRLRSIAKHDHRLSPGYWWPMSAEAEDAIGCIDRGVWPDPDAGERWATNTTRAFSDVIPTAKPR